ncbi:hypothetical protein [Vibrio quintilis]|nr:hypothetical protein [Vibrio quintilis]
MKVSELQEKFIDELNMLLPEWKFVKRDRHFKLNHHGVMWFFHISCVSHDSDFDAIGDVALEYLSGKKRMCIIGAELGNIKGSGQMRFPVSSSDEAARSAKSLYEFFVEVGLPFLNKYSDPNEVVTTLKRGGHEAMLISPFTDQHETQINLMCHEYKISM